MHTASLNNIILKDNLMGQILPDIMFCFVLPKQPKLKLGV